MTRAATITIIGLLVANTLWITWYYPTEGWRIVWFPVLSVYVGWRAISAAHRIAAGQNAVAIFKRPGRGFQVDLAHSHRGLDLMSVSGVLGALELLVVVGAGLVLYIVVFARLAKPLHLDFEAEWLIGAGGLSLLIALIGMTPVMEDRRGLAPLTVYVAIVGLVCLGIGVTKQYKITQARARCAQALAGATTVHERLRIRSATPSCREA
jgi:hypothetical protein